MLLPDTAGSHGPLHLREWQLEDAPELVAALAASRAHLSPWMAWANGPPASISETVVRIDGWQRDRRDGGDATYGIFLDGRVVGGCGLHRRLGPDGLELGYWVHAAFIRRGIATTSAILLADAAFGLGTIDHVEIHHDTTNTASAAIPERLGFELVLDTLRDPRAPGEGGIEWGWRMRRDVWDLRRPEPPLRA